MTKPRMLSPIQAELEFHLEEVCKRIVLNHTLLDRNFAKPDDRDVPSRDDDHLAVLDRVKEFREVVSGSCNADSNG
jgi:hypothetical protein